MRHVFSPTKSEEKKWQGSKHGSVTEFTKQNWRDKIKTPENTKHLNTMNEIKIPRIVVWFTKRHLHIMSINNNNIYLHT